MKKAAFRHSAVTPPFRDAGIFLYSPYELCRGEGEGNMEMILKLHEETWAERLPWKRICRGLAVIACFSVLAVGAVSYGIRYKEAALSRSYTGGGAYSEISREDVAGMMGKSLPIYPGLPGIDEAAERRLLVSPIGAGEISNPIEELVAKEIPASEDPAAEIPVINIPSADIPVENIPVMNIPVTNIPVTDIPVTDAPVADIPETKVPVTDVPETDIPITDIPVTDVPVTDIPEIKVPDEDVEDLPAMLTVSAHGNGGVPEMTSIRAEADGFTAEALPVPRRLGKIFDGWYMDGACTIPFEGGSVSGLEELALYAGWKEFPGFLCDDSGYIIGCTGGPDAVTDGILLIPDSADCVGIAAGAFDGLGGEAFETYIPGNITYIAPGAFDNLWSLMHIEVSVDNPVYYSAGGTVYDRNGEEVAYPVGLPRP